MAFCQNCGEKLNDGAKFCPSCGSACSYSDLSTDSDNQLKYVGKRIKCPNCGETLNSFTPLCPTCGFEFRETKASNSIQELTKKLEEISSSRTKYSFFSKIYHTGKSQAVNERMINLIRTYAIPNTREDIFEFMILASSNIDDKLFEGSYAASLSGNSIDYDFNRSLTDAWYAKFEQTYQKALLSFGGSPDFNVIKNIYEEKQKKILQAKKRGKIKNLLLVASLILPFVLLLIGFKLLG